MLPQKGLIDGLREALDEYEAAYKAFVSKPVS